MSLAPPSSPRIAGPPRRRAPALVVVLLVALAGGCGAGQIVTGGDGDGAPTPADGGIAAADGAPGTLDDAASAQDTLPVQPDGAPTQHDAAPGQSDGAPTQHDAAPGQQDAAPAQHDAAPAQHDAAPGQQDAAPAQQDAAPAQQDAPGPCLTTTTLSWTEPSQNEDGSCLTDLGGYKIYYSQTSGALSQVIDLPVGSPLMTCAPTGNTTTCGPETSCTHVISNLAPGTWYFAMTSYNLSSVESVRTGEVSKNVVCQ